MSSPTPKLSGPVGDRTRESGPAVKNKSADVLLVQKMLRANGYTTTNTGKVSSRLLEAIRTAQTRAVGSKNPDGVVDPGGKTFKALLPKYLSALKQEQAYDKHRQEQTARKVEYNNKTFYLTEDEYLQIKKQTLKALATLASDLRKELDNQLKYFKALEEIVSYEKGFMKGFCHRLVLTVSQINLPSSNLAKAAKKSLRTLDDAINARDLAAVRRVFPRAERDVNALKANVKKFAKEANIATKDLIQKIEFTKSGLWVLVVVLTAPAMGPVAHGAAIAGLQSAVKEVENYYSPNGEDRTVTDAAISIGLDSLLGAALGKVSSFKPGTQDEIAEQALKKASQSPGFKPIFSAFGLDLIRRFSQRSTRLALGEAAKSGTTQLMKNLYRRVRNGDYSPPTQEDLDQCMLQIVYDAITAGPLKQLSIFNKKFVNGKDLEPLKKSVPTRLSKLRPYKDLTKEEQEEALAKMLGKGQKEIRKAAGKAAISALSGKETAAQITDKAVKIVASDREVQSVVDKLFAEAHKEISKGKKRSTAR